MSLQNFKNFSLYKQQAGGKQPIFISDDKKYLLKSTSNIEQNFFTSMKQLCIQHQNESLNKYLPQTFSVVKLQTTPSIESTQIQNNSNQNNHIKQWLTYLKKRLQYSNKYTKFIVMENLTYNFQRPNILDLKLLKQKRLKNYLDKIRICGMKIYTKSFDGNYNSIFISKYYFDQIPDIENLLNHIALYFYDGFQFKLNLLKNTIQQLAQLILNVKKFINWRLFSSSICFFYDAANPDKIRIKLIDFQRIKYNETNQCDPQLIHKLQVYHRTFMLIYKRLSTRENQHNQHKQKMNELIHKLLNQKLRVISQRRQKMIKHCQDNNIKVQKIN